MVVACALALHFGQRLGSDQDAKDLFKVARTTDVRKRWVQGKLAQLVAQHDPVTLAAVEPVFAAVSQPPVPSPIDSAAGPSEPTPHEPWKLTTLRSRQVRRQQVRRRRFADDRPSDG